MVQPTLPPLTRRDIAVARSAPTSLKLYTERVQNLPGRRSSRSALCRGFEGVSIDDRLVAAAMGPTRKENIRAAWEREKNLGKRVGPRPIAARRRQVKAGNLSLERGSGKCLRKTASRSNFKAARPGMASAIADMVSELMQTRQSPLAAGSRFGGRRSFASAPRGRSASGSERLQSAVKAAAQGC